MERYGISQLATVIWLVYLRVLKVAASRPAQGEDLDSLSYIDQQCVGAVPLYFVTDTDGWQ